MICPMCGSRTVIDRRDADKGEIEDGSWKLHPRKEEND